MKRIKKAKTKIGMDDYMKAVRKADREAEMQLLGPGFHSMNRIHRSKKSYSRKEKHRGQQSLDASSFLSMPQGWRVFSKSRSENCYLLCSIKWVITT